MKWFSYLLCLVFRGILSLRYKVTIEGTEFLTKKALSKKGGILFLPNHPAHIDPILVATYFWPKFKMRPLVIEYIFRQSFVHGLMKLLHALPIPNFETSINELKLKQAEESLSKILQGLKKKENFLLYPAGRLKHTGKEIVGGASAAHDLLDKCPDANVVLIRTTGLWGSSFSRALIHRSPDLKKTLFKGLIILLKNGIFFTPRRKILVQIASNPADFPTGKSRIELNRYLETWYNRYPTKKGLADEEPLTLVSYSFFRKVYPKIEGKEKRKKEKRNAHISPQKREEILKEISHLSKHPVSDIHDEMNLALDLGLDSLDLAQLVAFLSHRYDTGEMHPEDVETVKDALEVSEGHRKTSHQEEETIFSWPEEKGRPQPQIPCGKTIPEAFLRSCDRMGSFSAIADDMIGPLSYRKMKLTVLVLAQECKKFPGKNIGILLPASSAAYLLILACMMAHKVPVMLNWTLGPKYLNDTLRLTDTKVVISSWRFLERLSYVEFGEELPQKLRLLEDIKKKISLRKKLSALWLSWKGCQALLDRFHLKRVKEDDTAVILFTSGTEAAPKGVPLSHKNIISNLSAGMQCISLKEDDVLFGILPPFHSFGFSVAGIFPIVIGTRVAFSPDPTDGFALAKGVVRWDVTMFCSAPSFLKGLLAAAGKHDLDRIRLFVSGAEKAPDYLLEKVRQLGKNKVLIEGYGITECSPIISLTRPNMPQVGVGQPVPGIEVCTIHPETHAPLREHEEGEICVRGPNVFKGYLGEQKSPFIEIHGKTWYCTGDLGHVDERGNIILSGRLKRFAKIGGEMVSLGAVEEALIQGVKHTGDDKPCIAICIDDKDPSRASLILFTTLELGKKEANDILKESGYSRLVKVSDVKKVGEIPMMGTGKTDYRKLQKLLLES